MSFLKTHCRADLPARICDLGNVFALFWQIIGFTAILPQIHMIWTSQSVDAVHVLWPTILVTASLANAFFVFSVEKRAFFKVAAVYYPIIYLVFLIEFWLLTKKDSQKKLLYAAICIIIWASLLTIELTVPFSDGAKKLNWISVVFYSLKIIPQLMKNIQLRTTVGQSSISVLLYCIESSFAFMSVYLLERQLKYRVMHYMSTSLYYINGIQVIWYPKPTHKIQKIHYGTIVESNDYSVPFEERNALVPKNDDLGDEVGDDEISLKETLGGGKDMSMPSECMVKIISSGETSVNASFGRSQTMNILRFYERLKVKSCWEIMLIGFLMCGLLVFTIGLCITANTFWAVCGPVSMFGLLFVTSVYRDYEEGSLNCPCIR